MSTGIHTQPAASILEDVDEFYFGGMVPWYHGTEISADRKKVLVVLTDPEEDEGGDDVTKKYALSAASIKEAFRLARKRGYALCCAKDITQEQLGLGCAQDLDIVLQTACYGELVFG